MTRERISHHIKKFFSITWVVRSPYRNQIRCELLTGRYKKSTSTQSVCELCMRACASVCVTNVVYYTINLSKSKAVGDRKQTKHLLKIVHIQKPAESRREEWRVRQLLKCRLNENRMSANVKFNYTIFARNSTENKIPIQQRRIIFPATEIQWIESTTWPSICETASEYVCVCEWTWQCNVVLDDCV